MNTRNSKLKKFSQELRKEMTPEERKLWYVFLNKQNNRFHRQYVVDNYILDFYCPSKKLAIEIDGTQHYTDGGKMSDCVRDEKLSELGIKIIRFSNIDINQHFKSVCETIYNIMENG